MKKKRPQPYKQGVIQKIANLFIRPLMKHKPPGRGMKQFLEDIFNTETREITQYVTKKDFSFVGALVKVPNRPYPGIKSGNIVVGTQVWVRIDSTHDDRVDVEVYGGQGKSEKVYQLTQKEFREKVKPFVEKVVMPERDKRFYLNRQWVLESRLLMRKKY